MESGNVNHSITDTTRNHDMFGQSENICEETVYITVASNQDVKEEIIQDVKEEITQDMQGEIIQDPLL